MIPKKCHLYWDGSPISWLQLKTIDSFHKYNPEWEIIIYMPLQDYRELGTNTFVPDYNGPDHFNELQNYNYIKIQYINISDYGVPLSAHSCQGSDNFRREILYRQGGVYSDFDVIWVRPIDHIRKIQSLGNGEDFESIVSFYELTHGFHNVSNLISEPGSQFIKSLIDASLNLPDEYIRANHQALGSTLLNQLYPTWDSVRYLYPRMLAIPYETFYPYSTYHLENLFIDDDLSYITENTLCVHWFNGNQLAKDYINKEDYSRKCSMTSILKNEGWL